MIEISVTSFSSMGAGLPLNRSALADGSRRPVGFMQQVFPCKNSLHKLCFSPTLATIPLYFFLERQFVGETPSRRRVYPSVGDRFVISATTYSATTSPFRHVTYSNLHRHLNSKYHTSNITYLSSSLPRGPTRRGTIRLPPPHHHAIFRRRIQRRRTIRVRTVRCRHLLTCCYPGADAVQRLHHAQDFPRRKCIRSVSHLSKYPLSRLIFPSRLAVHLADRVGFAPIKPRIPRHFGIFLYDGNLIGGALLGVGIAMTGACPGTSLVQLAVGVRSGLYVVLGGTAGGIAYVTSLPMLQQKLGRASSSSSSSSSPSSLCSSTCGAKPRDMPATISILNQDATLQATFKLSSNTLVFVWEVLCVLVIQLAGAFDGSGEIKLGLVGPVFGGCLIGAAQSATVLLTGHTVGVSAAYEHIAQAVLRYLGLRTEGAITAPSVLFAAGILSAGAVVSRFASEPTLDVARAAGADVSASTAILGGFVMVFGARLAGGCTSGHGISGLVTFSWASFVSVAAVFGSGILTAFVLR